MPNARQSALDGGERDAVVRGNVGQILVIDEALRECRTVSGAQSLEDFAKVSECFAGFGIGINRRWRRHPVAGKSSTDAVPTRFCPHDVERDREQEALESPRVLQRRDALEKTEEDLLKDVVDVGFVL